MVTHAGFYQSIRNRELGGLVANALASADDSAFDNVFAVAFYGIIELSGTVSSHFDKARAIHIARQVPNVTTVVESLEIRPSAIQRPGPKIRRRRPDNSPNELSRKRVIWSQDSTHD